MNVAFATIPGWTSGTWTADTSTSEIGFSVRLLGVLTVKGRFNRFHITIRTGHHPLGSNAEATIELGSVDTRNAKRDRHLRSPDFLATGGQPAATYRSTGVRHTAAGWVVDGNLTVHGIERPVQLTAVETVFSTDADGRPRGNFIATARLSRGAFGIDRWTGGGAIIGDKVTVILNVNAVQLEEATR